MKKLLEWVAAAFGLIVGIAMILLIIIMMPSLFKPFFNPVKGVYCPEYLTTLSSEDGTVNYCVAWPRLILSPIFPLKYPE